MAIWGEASYKVKRAITFHERFTVAELVDATDLTYVQVEQVVQRLMKQGYVRALEPHELNPAEQAVARRVGRPRQRYALTEDPVKQGEFYAEVEAIASAERLTRAKERKPNTPYFNRAMQVIEAIERGTEPFSSGQLEEATTLLAYGREFEALIPEGAEIAQARYDFTEARLEALLGNYAEAERLLTKAQEAFRTAGLASEVQSMEELKFSIGVGQRLTGIRSMVERYIDPLPAMDALSSFIQGAPSTSFLLLPLRQVMELLGAIVEVKESIWAAVGEMRKASVVNAIALRQNTEAVNRLTQVMEGRAREQEVEVKREIVEAEMLLLGEGEVMPTMYQQIYFPQLSRKVD